MVSPKPNTSLSLSFSDDDNKNNNGTFVPAADPVFADTTGNNNMADGTSSLASEEVDINIFIPIDSSAEAFYPPPAQGPLLEDDEESPTTGLAHKYVTPRPSIVTAPSSSTVSSSPTTGGIVAAAAPESPQRVVPVSQQPPMNLLVVPIVDPVQVCQVCTKRYRSKKALFGHMRSHPDRTWRGANPPPQFKPTNQSANPLWVVVNNSAGDPEMFDLNMVGEDDDDEEEEMGTPPAQCGIDRGFDLNKSPPKDDDDDGANGGAGMAIPVGADMVGLVA